MHEIMSPISDGVSLIAVAARFEFQHYKVRLKINIPIRKPRFLKNAWIFLRQIAL